MWFRREKSVDELLKGLGERVPRNTPGRFELPFGTVEYVDALSLQAQFYELFIKLSYDFSCAHDQPTIFDCGGNIGLSVLRFKTIYPKSNITVFEADPNVADVLERNLETHGHQDVELRRSAVWVDNGEVSFEGNRGDAGRIASSGFKVPSERLSDRIQTKIDMLKLDIEGAEYDVLLDVVETGKIAHVDRIICEFHQTQTNHVKFAKLLEGLSESGFHCTFHYACSDPGLPGPEEPTPYPAVPSGKYLLHMWAWRRTLEASVH